MFGRVAHRYDLLNRLLSGGTDVIWRRRAIRLLSPRPGERNLDLCSGTGDVALEVFRQSRGRTTNIAADFTFEMLPLGARKFRREKAGIPEVNADALHLPFQDASFDSVTVAFGVRNFENFETGVREIKRILKARGRLVILEFIPEPESFFGPGIRLYTRSILPRVGAFISGDGQAYQYLPDSVEQWPKPLELAERLEKVGFTNVRFEVLVMGISAVHIGVKGEST
jgi:demethylmenaquinone methyltransferase/2-methoxy-6-polyprenyl-1,4-benzoquinol methylase